MFYVALLSTTNMCAKQRNQRGLVYLVKNKLAACDPIMFCDQDIAFSYIGFFPRGGTPYIPMIGMIVVFFRGCNRRFSIF